VEEGLLEARRALELAREQAAAAAEKKE